MKVAATEFKGRKGWELDNDALRIVMLQGGGHLAGVTLKEKKAVNPLWVPAWRTIEPWQFKSADAKRFGIKLLGSICGHNLCLGWFGNASDDEVRAGMDTHGEAPVARWKQVRKRVSDSRVSLTCGCELPVARMRFRRTLSAKQWSHMVHVKEELKSLARQDMPYTMCQHVTMGPPFLEKGVTTFDMPATAAHTFPGEFGPKQRLKPDTAFEWPEGPGTRGGKVDMRTIGKKFRRSSDYSAQLMDPSREDAWFAAVNAPQGLLLAYVWKRSDFPWIGNWEENFGRSERPWSGRSLTRGMEFTNSPFPVGLRAAVERGRFQGEPTFRWLPARGRHVVEYDIILERVSAHAGGVADVRRTRAGFELDVIL